MHCIYCDSNRVVFKGYNGSRTKRRLKCKDCKKWFRIKNVDNNVEVREISDRKCVSDNVAPNVKINLNRLKKADILWLFNHRCRAHKMPFIEHPKCFLSEKPADAPFTEKIGFLDIEASNLKASFGYVFSYCIKELDGPLYEGCVTQQDIVSGIFDKRILKKCIDDMRKFDRIVVYYGGDARFDIPFLRTRAVYYKMDFPIYRELQLLDLFLVIKRRFKFHNNRLQTACDFFGIPCKEHGMNHDIWIRAMAGNKMALDYILQHNREDVLSTEALYKRVINYSNVPKQSL